MNAGVGPARFPPVQIRLSFFQAFKAHSLQRRFLGVGDTGFDFTFSIGVFDPTWHGHDAVMGQHILE
jgi:hypothetical protein